MKVKFIEDVLFERLGELKTVESEIPQFPIFFTDKLHFYKCKKYATVNKKIIELGIYFKFIIDGKISNDKEFKIIVDIYTKEDERYFDRYDVSELEELLSKYNIDDVNNVCIKVVKSITRNYF